MNTLACHIIDSKENIDAVVIWLHGLGASNDDFVPIVPRLKLSAELGIRFIFPQAPDRTVTINNGMRMPAWYDIFSLERGSKVDLDNILISAKTIQSMIDQQIAQGIASERIIIAGFSQGGVVAIEAALTYPQALGGLMVLSSYFATHQTIKPHTNNAAIPIEVYHGTLDYIVSPNLAEKAFQDLEKMNYNIGFHLYEMAHEVHPTEIDDIARFIKDILSS